MQTDQLQTLAALVDEGTFEAAARRLHVTPSAVSQRVKAMEQATGRVLVRRTTPVTLTEAGAVVLRHARQVELLEAETTRALGSVAEESGATRIPLAVNADSLATWFLPALAAFAGGIATGAGRGAGGGVGVVFDLHREDQEHTTSLLRSGTVMAAVTSTREPVQGCLVEPLGAMRYRAVCTPHFRERWLGWDPAGSARGPAEGAALGPALASALASAPVVHFDRNDDLQEAFLRGLTGSGGTGPRHFIPTSDDFARAVGLGFGWGVLPEQQCHTGLADGSLVDLAPADPVDVPLYWQRWNLASPLLDEVSTAVTAAAAGSLRG